MYVSEYHLCASVSCHRSSSHCAHLWRNVMQAGVGCPCSTQLPVYTRVSDHSKWAGVRTGHGQRRTETRGCKDTEGKLGRLHLMWFDWFLTDLYLISRFWLWLFSATLTQCFNSRRFAGGSPQGGGAAGCRGIRVGCRGAWFGHRCCGLFILEEAK